MNLNSDSAPFFYFVLKLMASKIKPPSKPETDNQDGANKLTADGKLVTEYDSAKMSLRQFREQWEDFLDLAYARIANANGYKSRVREGTLSTLLWERSTRVVAQLPTGKVQALDDKDDIGKSTLMDIVWHKYVMEGANAQYSYLTKVRLWDYNSFIYGAMPAMYDYRVDEEYVGPDWRVLDPRYVYPQAGRLSPNDCRKVFVSAYQDTEFLKSKLGQKGWNDDVLNQLIGELSDDYMPDNVWKVTNLESDRGQTVDLHKGQIELVTQYERGKKGRWITFAPDFGGLVLRDIPNPHESGCIPIVFKYCMPIMDSIWGMGHVERGASLQKAIDTYVNMAMDFAKFKLYPPILYTDGANMSQKRYEPGAKWKVPNMDAVQFLPVSGDYTQEFTSGYQFLKGALMNQNAANDTTIPTGQPDQQQGKTPEAIQDQNQGENTGDNFDRNMLEEALQELGNGMINLMAVKQPAAINFHIFDEDIRKIYDSGNKDVMEIFNSAKSYFVDPNDPEGKLQWTLNGKGAAKVTILPKNLGNSYKYFIDPSSTMQEDEQTEHEHLTEVLQFAGSPEGQTIIQSMQQTGKRSFDASEAFQRWIVTGGIKDWEKILPESEPSQQPQAAQAGQPQQAQQFSPGMLQDPQSQAMYQQMQPQQPPEQTSQPQMPANVPQGEPV